MAKGFGPILLLGGAAALFLLGKKKKIEPVPLESVEEGEAIEEAEETGEKPKERIPPHAPGKISGDPPNVTGHPWGYNAILFPTNGIVRTQFNYAGWPMEINEDPPPKHQIEAFQAAYNIFTGPEYPGILIVDGIPGKHTLNALEHVMAAAS